MSTIKSRTITRDDAAPRIPDASERDPNKIYGRDGREVSLRYTGDEDRFNLEQMGIFPPAGWTYEWKTKTIKNWDWVDHQVELHQNGWDPVPASRHDGLCMPKGHQGPIERGGLILMERDARLTRQARLIEKRKADEPVRDSRSMAGLMGRAVPNVSPDSMDFGVDAARGATGVGIAREARAGGGKYQYTIDE